VGALRFDSDLYDGRYQFLASIVLVLVASEIQFHVLAGVLLFPTQYCLSGLQQKEISRRKDK
jgi:hypothetical protein